MALAKRIIPCLDVDNGRVVKGVNFVGIRDAGDPVEIARRYNEAGADEITFLDITASHQNRDTTAHTVEQIAREVFIPLTVGGGIRAVEDIRTMLNAGADKVSINTAAIHNPSLVGESADRFGSQCIVVAIDAKAVATDNGAKRWEIFTHGPAFPTEASFLQPRGQRSEEISLGLRLHARRNFLGKEFEQEFSHGAPQARISRGSRHRGARAGVKGHTSRPLLPLGEGVGDEGALRQQSSDQISGVAPPHPCPSPRWGEGFKSGA